MWNLLRRNGPFRNYWTGVLLSQLGSCVSVIAVSWLVLTSTGSPLKSGAVFMFQSIPLLVAGILMGALVDIASRRSIMIVADLARAVLVSLIPLGRSLGFMPLGAIYGVVFVGSAFSLLFQTAEMAYMPRVVGQENLPAANSLLSLTRQAALIMGPALGGLLVAVLPDPSQALYFDAATFLWSAAMVSTLPSDPRPGVGRGVTTAVWSRTVAGLGFMFRSSTLVVLATTAAAANLMAGPLENAMAVLSKTALPGGAATYGTLTTTLGAGMAVGSLAASPLAKRLRHGVIIYSGILVFALGLALLGLADHVPVAIVAVAIVGFAMSPVNISLVTYFQLASSDDMRGRIIAAFNGLSQIVSPLGMAGVGYLLGVASPRSVVVGLAAFGVLLSLAGYVALMPLMKEQPLRSSDAIPFSE